ncbi:MAG TPA: S8 family serine peptidase [Patescibacteria group bacterium]|nr:S8 family serine peptidase [Patescibacteria group bacterium]
MDNKNMNGMEPRKVEKITKKDSENPIEEKESFRNKIKFGNIKTHSGAIITVVIVGFIMISAWGVMRAYDKYIEVSLNESQAKKKDKEKDKQAKIPKAEKTNNIIVRMKNPRTIKSATEAVKLASDVAGKESTTVKAVSKIAGHPEISIMKVDDKSKIDDVISELKKNPDVLSVEQDMIVSIPEPIKEKGEETKDVSAASLPNDPNLTWGYKNIKADQTSEEPNNEPMIAVIDTGVDYNHPELAGRVVLGHDYANNDDDPMDDHGHGTHCAGIAAATANNGAGSAGISSKSRILAIKALDKNGSGNLSSIISAIYDAADNPEVKVISMSFATAMGLPHFHDAIDYAASKGKFMVAASGNSNDNYYVFPALWMSYQPYGLAVAANKEDNCKASFSSYGGWVNISAPGLGIFSTLPNNSYGSWSGTSMATPFTAGVAARIMAVNSALSVQDVRNIILNNTDPNNFDNSCWPYVPDRYPWPDRYPSFGHINLAKSLGSIPSPSDPQAPEIKIVSPSNGYETDKSVIDISGTASDNDAVSRITWINNRGGEGTAEGTTNWQAKAVPLFSGINIIKMTAWDKAGNAKDASISITYLSSSFQITESSVAASPDDATEIKNTGVINLAAKKTNIGKGNLNGFHFAGVNVPKGAIIASASLSLQSAGYEKNSIRLSYYAEATDNATTFTANKEDITTRSQVKTLAQVNDIPATWTSNAYNKSPDLGSIIQELVNRDGWNSGNSMNILVDDSGSKLYRFISTFDQGANVAPKLKIAYSVSPPPIPDDNVAPSVSITSPAVSVGADKYVTTQSEVSISGLSSDNVGVTKVTYDSDNGASGDAVGTESWNIEKFKLKEGDNKVNVYAFDAAGNKGSASITIKYTPTTPPPPPPPPPSGKIELKVQFGADDGLENTGKGNMTLGKATVSLGKNYLVGFRFTGVNIPKGATITKATLKTHDYAGPNNAVTLEYRADAKANSDALKEETGNLSSRSLTSAKVSDTPGKWTLNSFNDSPDLSSVVQEIVNNSSWTSGNSLTLLIKDTGSTSYRTISAFERGIDKAPTLLVEYK